MIRRARGALLLLVVWLAGTAYSQQPATLPAAGEESNRKALSYTFVSQTTGEGLTLAEALRLLDSPEEQQFVNDIRRLSRCLRLKPLTVMRTIGNWTDGAEHSALIRVYTDRRTLRYADARLGKLKRQKSVLYFRRDETGEDRMYVLRIRRGKRRLTSIAKTLDSNGVPFRTLVPGASRRTYIYVVDLDDALRQQVERAARLLGAVMVMIRGTGESIGDDADRDKAQQVFAEKIKKYENENPETARRCSQ